MYTRPCHAPQTGSADSAAGFGEPGRTAPDCEMSLRISGIGAGHDGFGTALITPDNQPCGGAMTTPDNQPCRKVVVIPDEPPCGSVVVTPDPGQRGSVVVTPDATRRLAASRIMNTGALRYDAGTNDIGRAGRIRA